MMNKLLKTVCATAIMGIAFTSCEFTEEKNVDTLSNTFKELMSDNNDKIDNLVQGTLTIEELENFDNALKVVPASLEDEMMPLMELIKVSIDETESPVPLDFNSENTLFLHSKNNITEDSFSQKDSTEFEKGYKLVFAENVQHYDEMVTMWKQVGNKYEPLIENDSIPQYIKDKMTLSFKDNSELLNRIKYVVLVDDVLLISPIIDYDEQLYSSGYVATHVFVYDAENFEKLEQKMLISSNGDEIEYRTYSDTESNNTRIINRKLRKELLSERTRILDSVFNL